MGGRIAKALQWLNTSVAGGHLFAVLLGAFSVLAFAPFDLWPVGLLSIGLWLRSLLGCSPAQGAWRGFWFGVGQFGAGTSWVYVSIHVYGAASPPLAGGLTLLFTLGMALLFCTLPGWLIARLFRHATGLWLGGAALWVLGEWTRSWLLTGFPWLLLGYGHDQTWLAGWAPVGGVLALSLCVAVTGGWLCQLDRLSLPARVFGGLLITLLWLGGLGLKQIQWTTPAETPPVRVALVQGNIPQELKWNDDQLINTLQLYAALTVPLWEETDIVVWPEAAVPEFYQEIRPFFRRIQGRAREANTTLITGVPSMAEGDGSRYYNSVVALDESTTWYHKRRLVPFGEYVPLESWLRGLIAFFDLPMSAFSRGPERQPPLLAGERTLSTSICYEIVYPDMVARSAQGADLLLTVSNDTWFGNSIGPLQHLQIARMRALETGRYLLRGTNNGVTAIIDPTGRVAGQLPQFTREVLKGDVLAMRGNTPFMLTGSWPLVIICAALLALNLRPRQD